jgi:electron transport complex protein RnfD
LARTVLLISFPVEMTSWIAPQPLFSAHAPGFIDSLGITAGLTHPLDDVSSASVLGHVKTTLSIDGHAPLPDIITHSFHAAASFMGTTAGSLGETSALLFIAGGLFLIYLRIISWHIPVAMLATVGLLAWATHLADPLHFAPPLFHLLNGGLILGAFFIATDPVTSPVSGKGRLLFGAGCGILVFIIRQWGGYPEGVAFSVLLMNAATPLIDHYIRPRIFGRNLSGEPLPVAKKEAS